MPNDYTATTVQKVFDILDLFKHGDQLSLQDIKERLGTSRSTLFRLLYTLEKNQYLNKTETGKYELGLALFILGNSFSMGSQLKKAAAPHMRALSQQVNLSVHLGILVGTSVVILNKIDPPNRITMFSRVGIAVPAHCTGQGKTLLAFSPRERVEEVINAHGLKRYTANTITTADGLFEELRRIRERGYTIDDSEHEQHIRCVGVPILGKHDEAEAALSITGLAMDFDSQARIESTAQMLRGVAHHIRRDLGFC